LLGYFQVRFGLLQFLLKIGLGFLRLGQIVLQLGNLCVAAFKLDGVVRRLPACLIPLTILIFKEAENTSKATTITDRILRFIRSFLSFPSDNLKVVFLVVFPVSALD